MFRLAAKLGMTVRELESRMGSDELSEWLAFDGLYTIPDEYFTAGQVCRTVAGAIGGKQTSAGDFVPFFKPPQRDQTAAEARSIVRAHLAAVRAKRGRV